MRVNRRERRATVPIDDEKLVSDWRSGMSLSQLETVHNANQAALIRRIKASVGETAYAIEVKRRRKCKHQITDANYIDVSVLPAVLTRPWTRDGMAAR